jgi:hypothetical protein
MKLYYDEIKIKRVAVFRKVIDMLNDLYRNLNEVFINISKLSAVDVNELKQIIEELDQVIINIKDRY